MSYGYDRLRYLVIRVIRVIRIIRVIRVTLTRPPLIRDTRGLIFSGSTGPLKAVKSRIKPLKAVKSR